MLRQTEYVSRSSAAATTLADALVEKALLRGNDVAFRIVDVPTEGSGSRETAVVTYGALHRRASAVAKRLLEVAKPGDRALLLYEPGRDYVGSFFGCLYAGIIAVPSYPPNAPASRQRLQAIVADAEPSVYLTSRALTSDCTGAGLKAAASGRQAPIELATDDEWDHPRSDFLPTATAEQVAFLQYTSGSTGSPRGVVLSHANLMSNVRAQVNRFEVQEHHDLRVSWLPPYHDMGLIAGILVPIVSGTGVILMSPFTFIKDPISWLEAITRYKGTYGSAPNFAYDLCVRKITPERFKGLDLSSWRVAGVGSEPVRRATLRRFAQRFEAAGFDPMTFRPCYGLAEATLIVSAPPSGRTVKTHPVPVEGGTGDFSDDAEGSVSNGIAVHRTIVRIVDPGTSKACADGRMGEIWVKGPGVALGYWRREQDTQETFRAAIADEDRPGTYLRTGDLGFVVDEELYVAGRLKDVVILRGRNYYPQDIENTVSNADPRLRPGCCAVFGVDKDAEEGLVAVQELVVDEISSDELRTLAGKIRGDIARAHGIPLYELVLVRSRTSLKTTSGKIRRRPTKIAYLSDALNVIARDRLPAASAVDGDEWHALVSIEDKLRFALASALRRDTVTNDDDFFALGGDSLGVIETVTIASKQGVDIDPEVIYRHPTLRQLVSVLEGNGRREANGAARTARTFNMALRSPIPRVADAPLYDLSPVQRRWALDYLRDRSKTWGNVSFRVPFAGPVKDADVRRAIDEIWATHESLRTVFPESNGRMRQRIVPGVTVPFASYGAEEKSRVVQREAETVFDLETGPLARAALFHEENGRAELLVTLHHMVADGWSTGLLRQQLTAVHSAIRDDGVPPLVETDIRYRDYSEWMLSLERADLLRESREYWRAELEGPLPVTLTVEDRVARSDQAQTGASVLAVVRREVSERIKDFAKQRRVSDVAVLYAAFFRAIHEFTSGSDLIVGTPLAGRERSDVRNVVGMFINLVPVRVKGLKSWQFDDVLEATHHKLLGAVTHQRFQLDSMVTDFGLERVPYQFPVTNTFFTRMQMGSARAPEQGPGLVERPLAVDVRFHAMLYAYEYMDALHVELKYRQNLFAAKQMRSLLTQYLDILEAAVLGTPGARR